MFLKSFRIIRIVVDTALLVAGDGRWFDSRRRGISTVRWLSPWQRFFPQNLAKAISMRQGEEY